VTIYVFNCRLLLSFSSFFKQTNKNRTYLTLCCVRVRVCVFLKETCLFVLFPSMCLVTKQKKKKKDKRLKEDGISCVFVDAFELSVDFFFLIFFSVSYAVFFFSLLLLLLFFFMLPSIYLFIKRLWVCAYVFLSLSLSFYYLLYLLRIVYSFYFVFVH